MSHMRRFMESRKTVKHTSSSSDNPDKRRFITAEEWRKMSDKDIKDSVEVGLAVLLGRLRGKELLKVDREWLKSVIEDMMAVW